MFSHVESTRSPRRSRPRAASMSTSANGSSTLGQSTGKLGLVDTTARSSPDARGGGAQAAKQRLSTLTAIALLSRSVRPAASRRAPSQAPSQARPRRRAARRRLAGARVRLASCKRHRGSDDRGARAAGVRSAALADTRRRRHVRSVRLRSSVVTASIGDRVDCTKTSNTESDGD